MPGTRRLTIASLIVLPVMVCPALCAQDVQWTRQISTSGNTRPLGIRIHGPFVYVAGVTTVSLSPDQLAPSAGGQHAFVQKYSLSGDLVWSRQFAGSSIAAAAYDVAVSDAGVYLVGEAGTLPGQPSAGALDAFTASTTSMETRSGRGSLAPQIGITTTP